MSISSETRKAGPYNGNGVTTNFAFSFKVFADSDLLVVLADSLGAETEQALTTNYTVALNADQEVSPGGTVTALVAPATGYTLTISSEVENLQPVTLTNNGGFFPTVINTALDRLTILVQQIAEKVSRSLKLAISTPAGFNATLPAPVPYQLIGWNANGTGFQNTDPTYSTALATDLASSAGGKGGWLIGFISSAASAVATTLYAWANNWAVVKNHVTGNGVADDTPGLIAAVANAAATGKPLFWNGETAKTTATIPLLHTVKHIGKGTIIRGSDTWTVVPARDTLNKLYVNPAGSDANDGLSASQPRLTIQGCIDLLDDNGPIKGRQQIVGAAGTYSEHVTVPSGLALNENYLEFKFPNAPGARGDPSAWPAGGAILDGTAFDGDGLHGFVIHSYNNVYVEYLLVRDWYDTGLANTAQVINGILVSEFANLYTYGVSGSGNGFCNILYNPRSRGVCTGGILDAARHGIDVTGGRLSMTASAAGVDNTTIRNALEYGLHVKHDASAVLNYTEFLDSGQVAAAAAYGAAIFAYKSNASVDTLGCSFKRNNIVYNARGGFIATSDTTPDIMGTGADKNDRIWLIKGFGADDLINWESQAARDITQSFGSGSVTGATALAFDSQTTIPAGYLVGTDQSVSIEIYASNNAGGTAQCRPSMVTPGGTRYELGNFQVAASTNCVIRLQLAITSGGTVVTTYYDNNGATLGGTTAGNVLLNPIVFDSSDLEFQVWGDTTAANVLTIRKARVILWG